jgi:ribonuclease P protein component
VLDVRWLDNAIGYARLAIVVPRHGFTAVRRNTLKRRLRELARVHLLPAQCSCDVLIRARRDAYAASFAQLRTDVSDVAAALPSSSRVAPSP